MENVTINEFNEMVKAANEKGFKVWTGKGEYFDYTGQLGIENKNCQVYWFDICEDGYLIFNHVYNCNNGRTTKGFKQGYNFKWKMFLEKITYQEFGLN